MTFNRRAVKTARLTLRSLKPSDYPLWFDALVNRVPLQSKWDLGPVEPEKCTPADFIHLIKRHKEMAKKDDWYFYGVFENHTGQLIGHVDFDIFSRNTHQFANFGYQLYNRHWGLGYGQEAAAAGLKIGFKQLKLNRLEAAINLDNHKSIRLVKAIGMEEEGIKKRYWFENGKWTDHLIYAANPEHLGLKPNNPF
ncbi:GNAT family N-acetyltransferase [Iodobacter sp.]|uniref:GNAT family N-acetyltransferase n=1 Tax=Iodobacter sp. TaxID=1915058 RepID=UPI0025CD5FCC|nr:GNAT family protein [Iodobacter sp.]